MTRLPDWQDRLTRFLAQAGRRAFVPGRHDCALFAADAVVAMTGTDFAAPFRNRYTTLRGGIRILRRAGHADHVALAAHHLPEHPAPHLAAPGDLAVIATDAGPALGVVQGALVYVPGPDRLGLVARGQAIRSFRV